MSEFIFYNKRIQTVGVDGYTYNVGERNVIKINEHRPQGDGDRWFYDVHYDGGNVTRLFAPLVVEFVPLDTDLPF